MPDRRGEEKKREPENSSCGTVRHINPEVRKRKKTNGHGEGERKSKPTHPVHSINGSNEDTKGEDVLREGPGRGEKKKKTTEEERGHGHNPQGVAKFGTRRGGNSIPHIRLVDPEKMQKRYLYAGEVWGDRG